MSGADYTYSAAALLFNDTAVIWYHKLSQTVDGLHLVQWLSRDRKKNGRVAAHIPEDVTMPHRGLYQSV